MLCFEFSLFVNYNCCNFDLLYFLGFFKKKKKQWLHAVFWVLTVCELQLLQLLYFLGFCKKKKQPGV